MAYKQYTVGKIVRFGNTIERMLGIYHDKIVSSSYHKSGTLKTHVYNSPFSFLQNERDRGEAREGMEKGSVSNEKLMQLLCFFTVFLSPQEPREC